MRCDLNCAHCTRPAEKCRGGPSGCTRSAYVNGTQPTRRVCKQQEPGLKHARRYNKNGVKY